jgi:hypothetical protein
MDFEISPDIIFRRARQVPSLQPVGHEIFSGPFKNAVNPKKIGLAVLFSGEMTRLRPFFARLA